VRDPPFPLPLRHGAHVQAISCALFEAWDRVDALILLIEPVLPEFIIGVLCHAEHLSWCVHQLVLADQELTHLGEGLDDLFYRCGFVDRGFEVVSVCIKQFLPEG